MSVMANPLAPQPAQDTTAQAQAIETTQTQTAAPTEGVSDQTALPEWAKAFDMLASEIKGLKDARAQAAKPATKVGDELAQLREEVSALRAERTLHETLTDVGLTPSREQRKLIERLFKHEKPENPSEWLTEIAKAMGSTQPTQVKPGPVVTAPPSPKPQAPNKSDTGPMSGAGNGMIDPTTLPPHVWGNMKSEERLKMWQEHLSRK